MHQSNLRSTMVDLSTSNLKNPLANAIHKKSADMTIGSEQESLTEVGTKV